MKKILLLTFALLAAVQCAEVPRVEIYMIRKLDRNDPAPWPEIIVEISNLTKQTFYVSGRAIEDPLHYTEVLRKDKWLRAPGFIENDGATYPLKPGAKLLTTVSIPYEEREFRYRFFFWRTEDNKGKPVTVTTRSIQKGELGDLTGTIGELQSDAKLRETYKEDPTTPDNSVAPDAGRKPNIDTNGEQAGADQPATKPADKPPVQDQPSTPTSKDHPR
jgi:hypothetical protein